MREITDAEVDAAYESIPKAKLGGRGRKTDLGVNVWDAAVARVRDAYQRYDHVIVSFSGGKDSVTEDARCWYRIDGRIGYLSFGELLEATAWEQVASRDGQEYYQPTTSVEVATLDGDDQQTAVWRFAAVTYLMRHHVDTTLLRFTTSRGLTVTTTGDHSVMVAKGSRRGLTAIPALGSTVQPGDTFFAPCGLLDDGIEADVPDWLTYLAGLWTADGCYAVSRKVIISTGGNDRIVDVLRHVPPPPTRSELAADAVRERIGTGEDRRRAIVAVAQEHGIVESAIYKQLRVIGQRPEFLVPRVLPNGDVWLHSKQLVDRMVGLGLTGKAATKCVPRWVFSSSSKQVAQYLAGYFDGDGYLGRTAFEVSTVSAGLARDVMALLARLGITATLSRRKRGGYVESDAERSWVVAINRAEARRRFASLIPTVKYAPLPETTGHPTYGTGTVKVQSVDEVAYAGYVYDLEVADVHTFVANGILVHNSTCVMNVAVEAARLEGRLPVTVQLWDEEAIPFEVEHYVRRTLPRDDVRLTWWCLPVMHRNSCDPDHPHWSPWAPEDEDLWCRPMPPEGIHETHPDRPEWWTFHGQPERRPFIPVCTALQAVTLNGSVCSLLGNRAQESLRRRSIILKRHGPDAWLTHQKEFGAKNLWIGYPIYDWTTSDVWTAIGGFGWDYCRYYDLMEMKGIPHSRQRVGPPYADEPLAELGKYREIDPPLWDKMSRRVPGANTAAMYSRTVLYAYGVGDEGGAHRPEGKTWEDAIADAIRQHDPSTRTKVARWVGQFISLHYRKTSDPILDVTHPVTAISWPYLYKLATRGDTKERKEPPYTRDRKVFRDRYVAYQRALAQHREETDAAAAHPA